LNDNLEGITAMTAKEDYQYAQFTQEMEKQLERGLLAPDGSTIEMNSRPLSDAELSELKTAFVKISSFEDRGFTCIADVRDAVTRAIILEMAARRRTGLHLV
jgi:hypothetical protein